MTIRPQFRLQSLFILTAIVALACLVGPAAWGKLRPMIPPPLRDWFIWCSLALIVSFVGAAAWGSAFRNRPAHRLVFLGLSFLPVVVGFIGTGVGFWAVFSNIGKGEKVEPHVLANLMTMALMAIPAGGLGTVLLLILAIHGLRAAKRPPTG